MIFAYYRQDVETGKVTHVTDNHGFTDYGDFLHSLRRWNESAKWNYSTLPFPPTPEPDAQRCGSCQGHGHDEDECPHDDDDADTFEEGEAFSVEINVSCWIDGSIVESGDQETLGKLYRSEEEAHEAYLRIMCKIDALKPAPEYKPIVPTDEETHARAVEQYASDEIEIDEDAKVSRSPRSTGTTGAFVAAWVWVEDQ